jgi:hypothetical protein
MCPPPPFLGLICRHAILGWSLVVSIKYCTDTLAWLSCARFDPTHPHLGISVETTCRWCWPINATACTLASLRWTRCAAAAPFLTVERTTTTPCYLSHSSLVLDLHTEQLHDVGDTFTPVVKTKLYACIWILLWNPCYLGLFGLMHAFTFSCFTWMTLLIMYTSCLAKICIK